MPIRRGKSMLLVIPPTCLAVFVLAARYAFAGPSTLVSAIEFVLGLAFGLVSLAVALFRDDSSPPRTLTGAGVFAMLSMAVALMLLVFVPHDLSLGLSCGIVVAAAAVGAFSGAAYYGPRQPAPSTATTPVVQTPHNPTP